MSDNKIIQVRNLQKCFGDQLAVKDVSFDIKRGEIFGLLGPNGAGKTTIIKMMTTLSKQDAGKITVNGFDTRTQGRLARTQFSVTGQTATIDQDLSARENLMIFGRLNGLNRQDARDRASELLTDFDLVNSADQALATFSGGMRRRLDLAASLISKPAVLFLDEPTTGLDPRTRTQMWQAIRKLVANGTTVLLTTQYLEEAEQLADRIALIDHGKLVALGTPAELERRVGGMQLRIELSEPRQLAEAQVIVQGALQLPVHADARKLTVLLTADHVPATARILDQLQTADIAVNQFALETPSLDDVFLKMTVGKN
ncbi:ATP-binding cassette domain-containing protein [Lacticaseibacillus zhaodongensis]|uniref:ATP-binding cassette domain-containing protein n=1 Tax=Lacticaseibacillus zhaodongensis TaxID=2668065 RepID=UPI0012D35984|nr:ATP-binding cassette domain-containing protein [Lacticaseibacillus zhaodongensis]